MTVTDVRGQTTSPERWRLRRGVVPLLVAGIVAAGAVLAPTPTLTQVTEVQTRTESIVLLPRSTSRAGDAVAAVEATELRAALAAPDRAARQRGAEPFMAIGVTLAAEPTRPVLIRTSRDGVWTPWFEAHFDLAETPDPALEGSTPGFHSAPAWIGRSDRYQIDAPDDIGQLDVHLVGEVVTAERVSLVTPAAAASTPAIAPRSSWGARPPRQTPVVSGDLRVAVVHHSVTANAYSPAQVPAILRSIQAYHQDVNGWNDIAYSFAVDRFGNTWEARAGGIDKVVLGGHSKGFNTGTVGVVVLGDFTSTAVPSAAVEGVSRVIAWKFATHRVDPATTVPFTSAGSSKYPSGATVTLPRIVGHRDVQSTSCPGSQLYSKLGTIRSRAAELVPGYQQKATPDLHDGDRTGDGLTDPFEYRAGSWADTLWRASAAGAFTKQSKPTNGTYARVVGDFDANGYDDMLWHGTGSASDWIWWAGPAGITSQSIKVNASYAPVAGDFDGDGRDDVYFYSAGLGPDYVWYFNAGRSTTSRRADQDLSTGVPLVGDFNGDGRRDVFWYGPGSASDALWTSSGRSFSSSSRSVNGYYTPAAVDTNLDGRDDVTWVQTGATTSYRWEFAANGTHTSRALTTPVPAGRPLTGDFDGDGSGDVFLYAPGGAPDAFWYSTPTGVDVRQVTANGTYSVVAGPMDNPAGPATDDLLFVSLGDDYLWRTRPDRTYSSTKVG